MTTTEKIAFKTHLKQIAEGLIEQRIVAARKSIANAQEAANNEEKSSAGDKYETGRAMGHLEREMHEKQLVQQLNELAFLRSVKTDVVYEAAVTGACVVCANTLFFIAAGLGKQTVDGQALLFLSPQAPLTKLLLHKKTGDQFIFNGAPTIITEVY